MKRRLFAVFLLALSSAAAQITGAGATFPAPLYLKWLDAFQSAHPGSAITYDPVGSGEGLKRLKSRAIDFAASDIPVSDPTLIAIPTAVGAVVPIYNLPGISGDLRLTPDTLAAIFLGKIRRWTDPAIKSENRKLALPDTEIQVVHRGESSGTTFIWTSFLSKNPAWQSAIGASASIEWPTGIAAAGNEGVAQKVHDTPNSIGYAEFIYALKDRANYAEVRNDAGHFIQPDTDSIRAAAADPKAPNAFPITAVTWFVLPREMEPAKRARLVDFMNWMLDRGQNQAASLGFIPLSAGQLATARAALATLR